MKITKKQKPSLSIRERGLRDYMREHCDDGGSFTQPQQMIADELDISRPNVNKLVKLLVIKGYITLQEPANCENHTPAVYHILTPVPQGTDTTAITHKNNNTSTSLNDIHSTVLSVPRDRGEGVLCETGHIPCSINACSEIVDPCIPDEVEAGKCYLHLYAEATA